MIMDVIFVVDFPPGLLVGTNELDHPHACGLPFGHDGYRVV